MYSIFTVRKERKINAPAAVVWDVLTNPAFIEVWHGSKVQSDWKAGHSITFSYTMFNHNFVDKGSILQFDEQRIFSYNYWSELSNLPDEPDNYPVVTFELHQEENHVHLILLNHNIHNMDMYEQSDKLWEHTLDIIKELTEDYESHQMLVERDAEEYGRS